MVTHRTEKTRCKICQNSSSNQIYTAREMMFGTRDEFEYVECGSCGCLQIIDIPSDLSRYYPDNFYSLQIKKNQKKHPIRTFLRRQRARYCLYGKNKLWPLRLKKYGSFNWFKKSKINFHSYILDVGCGAGKLLLRMQRDGFINLTGIDPYIKNDITYRNGLKIFKKHIFELNGQYDLLMSHHSFEHMPQPLDVLNKFHELLKPTGYALIRIPVASSFAWRHYGVNWVGIDAPRHLFLHTLQSMHLLSKNAGFKMVDFEFDSTGHQFFASELYARNLSLNESSYYLNDPQKALFSDEQMEAFEEKARELNAKDDGDQACFYLQKV